MERRVAKNKENPIIPKNKKPVSVPVKAPLRDIDKNRNLEIKSRPKATVVRKTSIQKVGTRVTKLLPESEYDTDIFLYQLSEQLNYKIDADFMENHKTTPAMRAVLVDWLILLQDTWKMSQDGLHLCIWILDKILCERRNLGKESLQLVGMSAFIIACKFEDTQYPEIEKLLHISYDAFTKQELLQMERNILKSLGFRLGRPSSLKFLIYYARDRNCSVHEYTLAKYLLELAFLDYTLMSVKQSQLSAVCLCFAKSIIENSKVQIVWKCYLFDSLTANHFQTHFHGVKDIFVKLARLLLAYDKNSTFYKIQINSCKAISQKYSRTRDWGCIAPKLKGPVVIETAIL